VICNGCRRWNLSPVEERWEAIEQCERLYRSALRQVSTDQIGMAVLPEGMELVRIGQPRRPEFAAWRYGKQLMRRRRNHLLGSSLPGMALLVANATAPVLGVLAAPHALLTSYLNRRVLLTAADTTGAAVHLRRRDAKSLRILQSSGGDGWLVEARRGSQTVQASGADGIALASRLLPFVNVEGGRKRDVESAVQYMEKHGTGADFFREAVSILVERRSLLRSVVPVEAWQMRVATAAEPLRLALEMAAHEEVEHKAVQGELAILEAAWREAEEIAAIADNLLLPRAIADRLRQLRGVGGARSETPSQAS